MLDARRRRHRFVDRGGLISEPLRLHDDISNLNVWTEEERQTLSERYMQHPKQFHAVSAALERRGGRPLGEALGASAGRMAKNPGRRRYQRGQVHRAGFAGN